MLASLTMICRRGMLERSMCDFGLMSTYRSSIEERYGSGPSTAREFSQFSCFSLYSGSSRSHSKFSGTPSGKLYPLPSICRRGLMSSRCLLAVSVALQRGMALAMICSMML